MANTPVIKGVGLQWSHLTAALCSICRNFSHTSLACHTASVSLKPRSKRVLFSAQDQLHLAKIYEKKSASVFCPLAFSGKTWASVVDKPLPLVSFNGSAQSGSVSYGKPLPTVSGELEDHLKNIESSLVSLAGQIGELAKRLDLFMPAVSQSSPGCQLPVTLLSQNQREDIVMGVGSSDATSDKTAAILGSTVSPEVVKLENMLESLSASIANKFDGVRVFISGLDSGYFGSDVTIIMNNTLVKHVYKVVEVPGRLLSVKLLFRNKLSVSILGLYVGASVSAHFSQVDEINSLIAKAVNKSSFVILGSDFNEDGSHRCASFRKCFDLGLVNTLGGSSFGRNVTWTNSQEVAKVIDYIVAGVDEYFDTDHRAVAVSMGLSGLLDINLMSFRKQNATAAKWAAFKESSAATTVMFKCKFDAVLLFLDLDAMWDIVHKIVCLLANDIFKKKWFKGYDNVFTKEFSKFHKLELLVSKLVKASCLVSSEEFVALLSTWNLLNATNASVSRFEIIRSVLFRVRKLYYSSKLSKSKRAEESRIKSAVSKRMESFEMDKGYTIKNVLECPFHKVVMDHLVVDDELVLDPSLVKSKVDVIMEGWTRKCELVADVSADGCRQYQPLEYVFDEAFLRIMDLISSVELLGIVSDLPNDKAAGLSVPGPWKKAWMSIIPKSYEWKGVLMNTQPIALIKTACKILSKIFSDRISLACSTHNVLRKDNFFVLKGTTTQSLIFAVGSVVENALEKNCELWLVLQNMEKAYDSVGWEHLKRSLIRIKMCGRFI
ncbi:hypothetical protein G9A89_020933 [Geosiphon pyriformis]|nr:hypothetical protein G9A89_020933 [Geosiphon pyriformis]